jgi:hypothetical protein
MQTNLLDRLRTIENKMKDAWPDYAADLVGLPHAADLTVRDLATLMVLAPGEQVARSAVEVALGGTEAADVAIGVLDGHGLIVSDPKGLCLSARGRALLDRLCEIRAVSTERLLLVLPKPEQDQLVQGFEDLANAVHRAEALEKV